MTKFGEWCDRNGKEPTMENADLFAQEQTQELLAALENSTRWLKTVSIAEGLPGIKSKFSQQIADNEAAIRNAQSAQPHSDVCDLCHEPVTGSVHYVLVSGRHRCCRCMQRLWNAQDAAPDTCNPQSAQPEQEGK